MFVTPSACSAFGGKIPPPGTRCHFTVVVDGKTSRPRADDVGPIPGEDASAQSQSVSALGIIQQADLMTFIECWGLGDDAKNVLLNLEADLQYTVMMSFAPTNYAGVVCHSRAEFGAAVDGKFILFARGVEKARQGMGQQGKGSR